MKALKLIVKDKRAFWLFKACLAAVLLYFVFQAIDLNLLWQTIRTLQWVPLIIAVVLFYPFCLIGTWRWHYILARSGNRVSYWVLFRYSVLGQMTALVLPSQLSGDVVRTMAITRNRKHKGIFVLSVVIDKFSVLISILAFVLLGVFAQRLFDAYRSVFWAALVLFVACLGFFLVLVHGRQTWTKLLGRLACALHVEKYLSEWQQLSTHLSIQDILIVLGLAVSVQMLNSLGSYSMALAFSIQLDPVTWAAIGAIVAFAQMVPFTLGGLGIREGLFVTLLALYGIPPEKSIAYSLFGFVCVAFLLFVAWAIIESINQHFLGVPQPSDTIFLDL